MNFAHNTLDAGLSGVQTNGFEASPIFGALSFRFHVSLNEEHTWVKVFHDGKSFDLGERIHHYSLLTLARRRLEDARKGIEPHSQGWLDIERLSRMLGLDASHLNIQIFRVRKQIAQSLPAELSFPNIIERRRGEMRFGTFGFQIVRGSSIEGEFQPEAVARQSSFNAPA